MMKKNEHFTKTNFMIRLYVIEDHLTVILSSLRFLFRPQRDGIKIAGFSDSVDDTVCNAKNGEFDLFILDLYIPGYKPIDNIRKLKQHFPEKHIVIYTYEKSSSWRVKMMQEGAMAYITKDSTREELKIAIQKASKGEEYHSIVSNSPQHNEDIENVKPGTVSLTPIQYEIVKLLSDGLIHTEISDKTGVSRSLIEKILSNMRTTLNVKNNIELIKLLSSTGSL